MKIQRKQIRKSRWIKSETEVNLFLAGFSHLQSLCSWLVPNEFYSMLGRTGHQLIQIVFLHRGNCMLFYFWRGENEKTAFAPLFFLSLHHLPVSSQPRYSTTDHWIQESIKRIHIQFWAVLGSGGCREKKIQTAISMLRLICFYVFMAKKNV